MLGGTTSVHMVDVEYGAAAPTEASADRDRDESGRRDVSDAVQAHRFRSPAENLYQQLEREICREDGGAVAARNPEAAYRAGTRPVGGLRRWEQETRRSTIAEGCCGNRFVPSSAPLLKGFPAEPGRQDADRA